MTESRGSLAPVWNESGWLDFYETHRVTTGQLYPSEWFFLKDILAEDLSVLDIGCATGGLVSVLSEHLRRFRYTGVDISENMINRAREKHPDHRFHVIEEADLSVLAGDVYDLVICLGVLHLSRKWRELMAAAWHRASRCLLMDLRETSGATIEDEHASCYRVGHLLQTGSTATLPYNVINAGEALAAVMEHCPGAARLQHYGYLAPPSEAAVTTVKSVLMNTYRIDKRR